MDVTIKDLLELDSFRQFKLLAGGKGLDRIVQATGILDFEFTEGMGEERSAIFEKNSFVISSLLFAKDDKDLLIQVMHKLIDYGIAAFAYKDVFYKELPQEVLSLADSNRVPVFSFGDEVYFENIIYEIMGEIRAWSNLHLLEDKTKRLIEEELDSLQTESLTNQLNPNLHQYLTAVMFTAVNRKNHDIIKKCKMPDKLRAKVILAPYREKVAVILSSDNPEKLEALFSDILYACGLEAEEVKAGYSNVYESKQEISCALNEALSAWTVAEIEDKHVVSYHHIGQYQMLIPDIGSDHVQRYMRDYLQPIIDDRELMKTAVQYILAEGDMQKAADQLYCHKNTVRYRVNKLHQMLDEQSESITFYERLATAVKIYLLNHVLGSS